jgi:hypothetical protein
MAAGGKKKRAKKSPPSSAEAAAPSSPFRKAPPPPPPDPPRVTGWVHPWARVALAAVSVVYFSAVGCEATGFKWVWSIPGPLHFFTQFACLFPSAARNVIEYRAEGWDCSKRTWQEIDVRPYFPIHRDEKENRFQRTMHFYRQHRATMQALDEYVVSRHNQSALASAARGGPAMPQIGGVRLMSLRIPFGSPGSPIERFTYKPIDAYPREIRKHWFWTRNSKRRERCTAMDASYRHVDEADPGAAPASSAPSVPSATPEEGEP